MLLLEVLELLVLLLGQHPLLLDLLELDNALLGVSDGLLKLDLQVPVFDHGLLHEFDFLGVPLLGWFFAGHDALQLADVGFLGGQLGFVGLPLFPDPGQFLLDGFGLGA